MVECLFKKLEVLGLSKKVYKWFGIDSNCDILDQYQCFLEADVHTLAWIKYFHCKIYSQLESILNDLGIAFTNSVQQYEKDQLIDFLYITDFIRGSHMFSEFIGGKKCYVKEFLHRYQKKDFLGCGWTEKQFQMMVTTLAKYDLHFEERLISNDEYRRLKLIDASLHLAIDRTNDMIRELFEYRAKLVEELQSNQFAMNDLIQNNMVNISGTDVSDVEKQMKLLFK